MRSAIIVTVTVADRKRLEAILGDPNSSPKQIRRCNVILCSADGLRTSVIMRNTGASKWSVWRWQERFMAEGVEGLMRDKTRPPGKQPLGDAVAMAVVGLTFGEPPGRATHWTGRLVATTVGVSLTSVQRIWRAYGIDPRRTRTFRLSQAPKFAANIRDIAGLYVGPRRHALVLSTPKSSARQPTAIPPGAPIDPSIGADVEQAVAANRALDFQAALNRWERDGFAIRSAARRQNDFIDFLDRVECGVPASQIVHVIIDRHHPDTDAAVIAWLGRHPRWTFHFLPENISWPKAIEGLLAALQKGRLGRNALSHVPGLQLVIDDIVAARETRSRTFIWVADQKPLTSVED